MKNAYEIQGVTTVIFLNRKDGTVMETGIDTKHLEKAKAFPYTWVAVYSPLNDSYYVAGKWGRKTVILHRYLMDAGKGTVVDHRNHDTLKNTTDNLRVVTQRENQHNRKGANKNSKSGVRGVCWVSGKQKWKAYITLNYKATHLGYFNDKQEAAARVQKERERLGLI